MKIGLSWINDFTDISGISAKEYMAAMTMSGTKVEGFCCKGDDIKNVVVGKILTIDKHPDADKLQVCSVLVGDDNVQIVTGAQNVFVGALVPVALHGAKLPGGVSIKKGKLRGVESCGMMCSTDELAISDKRADGILILNELYPDCAPGQDVCTLLGLDDIIAEFEITSNRPDCLSVIGLARESAVTFGKKFSLKVPATPDGVGENPIKVTVTDSVLCPRFAAGVVKNVKIAPSPAWMQQRLIASGVRPISNIVDITNYVMLEYGQPMHAFDIDCVDGRHIVVRRAHEGEHVTTLDGTVRVLDTSMLVIADEKKAIGLAGVMGGENSEIKDSTTTVVFESASFNSASIRSTSKKLGLRTDAAMRFEKNIDPCMTIDALNRACELVVELGAGEVCGNVVDVDNTKNTLPKLKLDVPAINKFLGASISSAFMIDTLTSLGFSVDNDLNITIPSFRLDVEGIADIAEEVARIYGYDKFAPTVPSGMADVGGQNPRQKFENLVKSTLASLGMYEVFTYSFTDPKHFDMLQIPEGDSLRNAIAIKNPLGVENSVMRTTTVHSLLEVLLKNYNVRNAKVCAFELGKVYVKSENELPHEPIRITLGVYGHDFFHIKGLVCELLSQCHVDGYTTSALQNDPSMHPGKSALFEKDGLHLGYVGEVRPTVAKNYGFGIAVYVAVLDFDLIFDIYKKHESKYAPLPKYPSVVRDIAVTVDSSVPVGALEATIAKNGGKFLESVTLFDVYAGEQIGQSKKSVAFSAVFRAGDKTLTDAEASSAVEAIVSALVSEHGAARR